jgi:RNA polymerase sigma factor (sigma-70 family)
LNLDEINLIAKTFLELKEKAQSGNQKDIRIFKEYQNICVTKLASLVTNKTHKYKKFGNYSDLCQDGFEALMLSLETYDPNKGCFAWWASKYIGTRVSRAANAHSTIRVPLKKANLLPPYKTDMPLLVDEKPNQVENAENSQYKKMLREEILKLPRQKREIALRHYDIGGFSHSVKQIAEELNISQPVCVKLLGEAEESLKRNLRKQFAIHSHSG